MERLSFQNNRLTVAQTGIFFDCGTTNFLHLLSKQVRINSIVIICVLSFRCDKNRNVTVSTINFLFFFFSILCWCNMNFVGNSCVFCFNCLWFLLFVEEHCFFDWKMLTQYIGNITQVQSGQIIVVVGKTTDAASR